MVSGDQHSVNVRVENSKAMVFSQSAEKIYKSINNTKAIINNEIIALVLLILL